MTIRVLHVIPSVAAIRGGPSKAVIEMVAALNETGIVAEIASTNDNGDELLDVALESLQNYQNVPVRFFARWSPRVSALREFQYSSAFKHWLDLHITDYDLIQVHAIFSFTSSYAMCLARKRGIPYVVRPIGQLEHWALKQGGIKKRLYLKLLERNNLSRADAIHFTADSELQQAQAIIDNPTMRVIPLGIITPDRVDDASRKLKSEYSLPEKAPVVIYLSRLHPKKGLELLLEALAGIDRPFTLLIAGSGEPDYVTNLENLVTQLGLHDQVKFIGFVQGEKRDLLLQGANLFTLTSYSENFGIAVLEALACGTPALVTEGVALASEIREARLGYVAEPNVADILKQLTIAFDKMETRSTEKQRIRDYVDQKYRWSAIADQLKELYLELMNR